MKTQTPTLPERDRLQSLRGRPKARPGALPVALLLAGLVWAPQAAAEVTFYADQGFAGRSFTAQREVPDFGREGLNNRTSSVVVRAQRWEVCDKPRFEGQCMVLRPGQYPSLASMGLNDRISSARLVNRRARFDDDRFAPAPPVNYGADVGRGYNRRRNERLYEAPVSSVRAVVGTPQQRCWVEREQVVQERSGVNTGGAVLGAVIGGVLGHQVGGGTGRDVATAIGVVTGAAVGSRSGRNGGTPSSSRDVQRCSPANVSAQAEYWDVTYRHRGIEHHVQMTTPPGDSITVNAQGEPRS